MSQKIICILVLKKVLYNLRLFLKWLITWSHPPSINKWLITLFPTLSRPLTNQVKSTNANIPNINWHETHKKGILVNKHSMVFSLECWKGDFFFVCAFHPVYIAWWNEWRCICQIHTWRDMHFYLKMMNM